MMKKSVIGLGAFFVLLTALAYVPSFTAPFQFDDGFLFHKNTVTRNFIWEQIWQYDPSRFLTNMTFVFNYVWGAQDVFSYHAVNFVIHLGVGALAAVFLHQLLRFPWGGNPPAGAWVKEGLVFSVLIFLLHPIQTSAVIYVIQRSTLLASFFYLAALVFYCRFILENNKKSYVFVLLCTALGALCKPIIFTLPLTIIFLEILVIRKGAIDKVRVFRRVVLVALTVLLVPVLLSLWKYKSASLSSVLSMSQETDVISRAEYLRTQFSVLMTYLKLLFLPLNQQLDYDFPISKSFFELRTMASLAGLIFIAWLAVKARRKVPAFTFFIFWFLCTLSLESSIFPIADVIFEHRLYLPMLGFAFFVPAAVSLVIKNRKIFIIVLSGILLVYGTLTFQRGLLWQDPEKFLLDGVFKAPKKARVYHNLGNFYLNAGKTDAALENFYKALELDPYYIPSINNIGNIKMRDKQYDEALKYYNLAIQLSPDYEVPYFNRASIYLFFNNTQAALDDYAKVLEINPYVIPVYINRGNILSQNKNYKGALLNYNQALVLDPQNGMAYYNRSLCYFHLNDFDRAYADILKAEEYQYPVEKAFVENLMKRIQTR